jgi:hypothetical protein
MRYRKRRQTDAALCRLHGWTVGHVLRAERFDAPAPLVHYMRITAIGEEAILAKEIGYEGPHGVVGTKDRPEHKSAGALLVCSITTATVEQLAALSRRRTRASHGRRTS